MASATKQSYGDAVIHFGYVERVWVSTCASSDTETQRRRVSQQPLGSAKSLCYVQDPTQAGPLKVTIKHGAE